MSYLVNMEEGGLGSLGWNMEERCSPMLLKFTEISHLITFKYI